jgi:hypothetical protein
VVDGPSCIYQRCWNPKSSTSCIFMILLLFTCRVGFMSIKVLKSQPAHAPGISYLQEGIPKWIYCSTKPGFPVVYFILIRGMGVSSQIWLNIHNILKANQHQSGLCIHTYIYIYLYRKNKTQYLLIIVIPYAPCINLQHQHMVDNPSWIRLNPTETLIKSN